MVGHGVVLCCWIGVGWGLIGDVLDYFWVQVKEEVMVVKECNSALVGCVGGELRAVGDFGCRAEDWTGEHVSTLDSREWRFNTIECIFDLQDILILNWNCSQRFGPQAISKVLYHMQCKSNIIARNSLMPVLRTPRIPYLDFMQGMLDIDYRAGQSTSKQTFVPELLNVDYNTSFEMD